MMKKMPAKMTSTISIGIGADGDNASVDGSSSTNGNDPDQTNQSSRVRDAFKNPGKEVPRNRHGKHACVKHIGNSSWHQTWKP